MKEANHTTTAYDINQAGFLIILNHFVNNNMGL